MSQGFPLLILAFGTLGGIWFLAAAARKQVADAKGRTRAVWTPGETVQAIAYDTPIVGWRGIHVNALRLWSARAPDPLLIDVFNTGDYLGATAHEARAEAIIAAVEGRG